MKGEEASQAQHGPMVPEIGGTFGVRRHFGMQLMVYPLLFSLENRNNSSAKNSRNGLYGSSVKLQYIGGTLKYYLYTTGLITISPRPLKLL